MLLLYYSFVYDIDLESLIYTKVNNRTTLPHDSNMRYTYFMLSAHKNVNDVNDR